jgi:hypothetical protein
MIRFPLLFPFRSGNVQRVNEFHLYELASAIHPLLEAKNDAKYSDVWYEWFNARFLLHQTFNERRPLSVSRPAADKLYRAIGQFIPVEWEEAVKKYPAEGVEDPIIGYIAYSIRDAAKEFETVLAAELYAMDTYFVSQIGSYKTCDLIEKAHISFPETVQGKLSEQAKLDFDQAGKCIAFGVSTAAAFHLVRGTESVIRKYYETVTGKPPKPQMRNWGAYQKILEDKGAEKKITDLIEHVRVAYRNPVLHPEENFSPEQTLVLFGVCISAVTLMIAEIDRLTSKGGVLVFPATTAIAKTSSVT